MNADIITFDCYGTLIDWESGIAGAFQEEAARDGVRLEREAILAAYMAEEPVVEEEGDQPYREVLALTATRAAARLGWEITRERAEFLSASLPSWQPFADTNAALERLAKKFQLAILSNIYDDLIAQTRRHFTVGFAFVVTAEQVRSYKPAHGHFREGLRRAGDKRVLHAAQSYFHDVMPSRELGIPVVWVNRGHDAPRPGGPLPDAEVADLTELANLLGA